MCLILVGKEINNENFPIYGIYMCSSSSSFFAMLQSSHFMQGWIKILKRGWLLQVTPSIANYVGVAEVFACTL